MHSGNLTNPGIVPVRASGEYLTMPLALTAYQGRVGDHNNLAMPGAVALANSIGARLKLEPVVLGTPEPALNVNWDIELRAAMPGLRTLQDRFEQVLARGQTSIAVFNRCAASLASLPVVARHFPGSVIVWFDAHADLNTPDASITGYLGGLALSGPAGLWDSGLGDGYSLENVILVGQRDLDPYESALIESEQIALVRPGPDLAERLTAAVGGCPAYVHIDCDVLEPGIVPTDYVIPDGLTLDDLRAAAEALARGTLLGLEVTEFQYSFTEGGDPASPEQLVDALMPMIGALAADALATAP